MRSWSSKTFSEKELSLRQIGGSTTVQKTASGAPEAEMPIHPHPDERNEDGADRLVELVEKILQRPALDMRHRQADGNCREHQRRGRPVEHAGNRRIGGGGRGRGS